MGSRASFGLLVAVTVAAWGIPVFEMLYYGALSLVALVTAFMLTAMVVAWPFLTGRRLQHGHLERALMCVECKSLAWPAEQALGFCLRCGSVKKAIRVTG